MYDEGTIEVGGRAVGYADFGPAEARPVLWCHGGPGSRIEPLIVADAARAAGFRLIGIDRPGYGKSVPQPGRTIESWVPDGLAVADHLGIESFIAVGVSTGGSYAMALAALVPERVDAAIACCSVTDTRWEGARRLAADPHLRKIWGTRDRTVALQLATDVFGADGSKMALPSPDRPPLAAADIAMLTDPARAVNWAQGLPEMFAWGIEGYADDRLADGLGWGGFPIDAIRCPVTVLHGRDDTIVPLAYADYTAEIVPGARLHVVDGQGHLSIITEVVPALTALLGT
jgi:pimeloyl-ACP methyl ester carboxylesterase